MRPGAVSGQGRALGKPARCRLAYLIIRPSHSACFSSLIASRYTLELQMGLVALVSVTLFGPLTIRVSSLLPPSSPGQLDTIAHLPSFSLPLALPSRKSLCPSLHGRGPFRNPHGICLRTGDPPKVTTKQWTIRPGSVASPKLSTQVPRHP